MIYRPTTQDDFSASQCIFRFRAEISISKNKVQFCGFFTKTMIQNITEGTKLNQRLGAITATLFPLAGKPASFVTDLLQSQESLGGTTASVIVGKQRLGPLTSELPLASASCSHTPHS